MTAFRTSGWVKACFFRSTALGFKKTSPLDFSSEPAPPAWSNISATALSMPWLVSEKMTLCIASSGKVQGLRFKVKGARFKVKGARFKVKGSGCKVQDARFRFHSVGLSAIWPHCHFERKREIFYKQDSSSLARLGMTRQKACAPRNEKFNRGQGYSLPVARCRVYRHHV